MIITDVDDEYITCTVTGYKALDCDDSVLLWYDDRDDGDEEMDEAVRERLSEIRRADIENEPIGQVKKYKRT